jgi:hypothetical protein
MLARTLAVLTDDPALAWSWLVADSGYGRDAGLRAFCHQQAVAYVLAVPRRPGKRPQLHPDDDQPGSPGPLIGYSLAAIRGLLAATTLARNCLDWTAAITRDLWRRAHQARAKISHYRRRGDPLPKDL